MNESISRSAGAECGQELPPERMEALIRSAGRAPRQRTTLYGDAARGAGPRSFGAPPLAEPLNPPVRDAGLGGPRSSCARPPSRPDALAARVGRESTARDRRDRCRAAGAATAVGGRRRPRAPAREARCAEARCGNGRAPGGAPRSPRVRGGPRRARRAGARARGRASASRGGERRSSRCTPAASPPAAKNAVRADRLGDDERPLRGPPERRLAPSLRALEGDRLERASGKRVGRDDVRDAELPGDRRAVAVVAVEELEHRRWLSELPCTRERRLEANGIDEPHSAVGGERVRRARHRLVDDPREPLLAAVVAEPDRHAPSVRQRTVARSARCRTSDPRERLVVPAPARRVSPVVDRPESREGSFPAPGASLQPPPGAPRCPWCHAIEDLVTGVCRLCADSVPRRRGGRRGAGRRLVRRRRSAWVPAHTGRRAANGGVAALRSSPPARSGRLRMPAVGDAARMGA